MCKSLVPERKRLYVIEMRSGSGVTRRVSDHLPHSDRYGWSSHHCSKIYFDDGIGIGHMSRRDLERYVDSDRYMELRFKRLLEQARARKEVAV